MGNVILIYLVPVIVSICLNLFLNLDNITTYGIIIATLVYELIHILLVFYAKQIKTMKISTQINISNEISKYYIPIENSKFSFNLIKRYKRLRRFKILFESKTTEALIRQIERYSGKEITPYLINTLAVAYIDIGEYEKSSELFLNAMTRVRENTLEWYITKHNYACLLCQKEEYAQAYSILNNLEEYAKKQKDSELVGNFLFNFARVKAELGMIREALEDSDIALSRFQTSRDIVGELSTCINKAVMLRKDNRNIEADSVIEEAFRKSSKCGDPNVRTMLGSAYGSNLRRNGELERGHHVHLQTLDNENGNEVNAQIMGMLLAEIGNDFSIRGDHESALRNYAQAAKLFIESESSDLLAPLYASMGEEYSSRGDAEAGLEYLKKSMDLFRGCGNDTQKLAVLISIAKRLLFRERNGARAFLSAGLDELRNTTQRVLYGYLSGLMGFTYFLDGDYEKSQSYIITEHEEYKGSGYLIGVLCARYNMAINQICISGRHSDIDRLIAIADEFDRMKLYMHMLESRTYFIMASIPFKQISRDRIRKYITNTLNTMNDRTLVDENIEYLRNKLKTTENRLDDFKSDVEISQLHISRSYEPELKKRR